MDRDPASSLRTRQRSDRTSGRGSSPNTDKKRVLRMPSGGESHCQEANKEDQMVECRRSTKQEPEESQDGDICSSETLYSESDTQQKRHRVFLPKWQTGRPWLKTIVETGQVTSMYCEVCQRHPLKPVGPGKPNDTFIKGSTNFRLEAVIRHEMSLVHQKAQGMCEDDEHRATKRDVHKDKNKSRKLKASTAGMTNKKPVRRTRQSEEPKMADKNVVNLNDVTPLFRNTHAVALHGRSLSDYVWLCQLDVAKGLQLPREYLTVKYAKTFLYHIARAERDRMKVAVQRSKFVSVIIDKISAPDGADFGRSEEVLYLKSVSEGQTMMYFIQRFNTEHPYDYQHVYKLVVKETLDQYMSQERGDIWCKTVGFGLNQRSASEGRGAVLDVFKEVFLQRAPWIEGVHCEVGQMEDSVQRVLSDSQLYITVQSLFQDLYELYKNPLNRVALKVISFAKSNRHKVFKLIQPPNLSAQNKCSDSGQLTESDENTEPTGWIISLLNAAENLTGSYSDIAQHCQERPLESPDETLRMRRIHETLHDRDAVLFIQFLRDVLEDLRRLFKLLRDPRSSLFNNYIVTKAAVTKLKSFLNGGGKHLSDIRQQLTSSEGCYCDVKLTESDVRFHHEMLHVVTSMCEALDTGYHDINMQVLSATIIADLGHWPQSLIDDMEFGDDCVKTLLKHFTPVLEHAQVKLHRVEVEWNSIKMHLYNCSEPVHQRSWWDIHRSVGKKFANFLALIDLVLTLPSYCCLREQGRRLAQQMNLDRRRYLDDSIKSDLMTVMLNIGSVSEFNPKRAVELWAQETGFDFHIEEEYVSSHRSELASSTTLRDQNESDYDDDDEDGDDGNDATADENDNDDTTDEHYDDVVKEFRCSLCENMFGSEVELVAHKRAVHMRRRTGGNKPCSCPVCKKTFKNKPSLSAHVSVQHRRRGENVLPLNAVHGKKRYGTSHVQQTLASCNMCEATFPSSRALRHHKLIHHKLSPYRCDQCAKCFKGKTALVEHRRCHSGEKPHACNVCGKRFRRSADVKEHARTHDENRRRYPCSQCSKSFTQKIHLKYHLMTHTNNFRYYCDQCGKGFQMNCLLVRHKTRAHTHIKPFKCPMCQKSFKTKRDLKIHIDSHDPSKNYICNQCGKMFQSKHLVDGHVMRMHEKDKLPLECATCGKRFRHPTMLLAHERVHTGETPFQCHTCGKTFKQKGHLTAHNRTHTGEKPYRCELCDTSFTVSCSLKKHMKYVHEGIKRQKPSKSEKAAKSTREIPQRFPALQPQNDDGNIDIGGGSSIEQYRPVDMLNPNQHVRQYSNLHEMQAPPGGHLSTHMRNSTGHVSLTGSGADGQMMHHMAPSGGITADHSHQAPVYSEPHPVQPEMLPGGAGGSMTGDGEQMVPYWFLGGHYQEPGQQ